MIGPWESLVSCGIIIESWLSHDWVMSESLLLKHICESAVSSLQPLMDQLVLTAMLVSLLRCRLPGEFERGANEKSRTIINIEYY